MSTINYLTVRNTIMPVVRAVTGNYSTLTGSTITGSAIATSTIATSAITVSTLNLASTMISLGQSTNQTYNNFSNGSYLTWATAKSAMTSANKTVQSANGLYQMIVANATSGLFLSSDSGITWSTLTGGLPTLTGSAYWSDGAISANGQYITLSIYGGSLWMSADYGRTFALTNQPTPNIWLPLNGNTTDSMGSSTVTTPGTVPGYVTLNYPGYTAQAVNLANTAGAAATRYIRGTWAGASNFTVSLWFNAQSLTSVYQNIFSAYAGAFIITIADNNTLYAQIPSGGASGISNIGFTSALTVNTWYYVTVIYQTNGLCSFYVNNVLIGSVTNTQGVGSYTSSAFGLGSYDTSTSQAFNGYVDDLRITHSVSTYVPIPLLQPNIWLPFENNTADLGSQTAASSTIYLPFEGNVTDSMGFSTPNVTGPVTYVAANREGYTGQAIRLTNTAGGTAAQYVRGTWSGTTNFTVSFWFNAPSAGGNFQLIISAYNSSLSVALNGDNSLTMYIPNASYILSGVLSVNTWHFVTSIFRTNGTCSFYIDNNLIGSVTNTGGFGTSSGFYELSGTDNSQAFAFNGTIDDFRFYNYAITYAPVSITTVTGSLSYVPGVVGLNAVNLVNPPGGTPANYISGSWPALTVCTVSGWFNIQSFSTISNQFVCSLGAATGSIIIFIEYTSRKLYTQLGASQASIGNALSLNTWYYFQLTVSSSSSATLYLNSDSVTFAYTAGGAAGGGFSVGTYSGGGYAFNGYVDDFRIYNAAIPIHVLFPQNYRSLALSGTGQYALATTASGWVVGSSNSSQTWSKQAVCVGTQNGFIQPNMSGLPVAATTWTQNGVTWTATESSNNGASQTVSRAFNNNTTTDAWLSNNTTSRYTAGATNVNAASTTIQTIGATAGEWIQIESSIPMVLANFAFGIGLNPFAFTNTPKTYYIVGSTDGTTWVPLQFGNFTISAFTATSSNITMNITGTQPLNGNMVGSVATTAYPSYTPNAYSYFRLIGTSLMLTGPGGTYMEIGEWFLNFVLPLTNSRPPAHVLSLNHTGQYQLVATGPAAGSIMPQLTGLAAFTWTQNGVNWGASASSTLSGYQLYALFNNTPAAAWLSALSMYNTTSGAYASTTSTTILGGVGAQTGEWVQIQSSVPLVLQSYSYADGGAVANIPKIYYIVGSNDGSTWYPLQYVSMTTNPFTTSTYTSASTSITLNTTGAITIQGNVTGQGTSTAYAFSTQPYMYFRMVIQNLWASNAGYCEFTEWFINFQNSVSYSANYGSTWLNTSSTVSNESVALSSSGQYSLSTNSVAPLARLTLDNTNVDTYGILVPATGAGTVTYSTSIKTVGTHSGQFVNTAGGTPSVYLNYTVPTALNTPSTLTMACWVYPSAYGVAANSYILNLGSTGTHGCTLGFGADGVVFSYTGKTSGGAQQTIGAGTAPLNTWTHVAMTYNANLITLYVNGVVSAQSAIAGNLSLVGGGNITNLLVGCSIVSQALNGYVDDVRIYTSALSATAISTLYNNPTIIQSQIVAVSNSYLPITSYTFPAFASIGTANIVDTAVSQTGQYMVAVTSSTTNNVYYSTDYGATFTALTVGSSAMVSCSISYDGSYLTVTNATTTYTLNRNTRGFSVTVGNQAGLINQAQNAIAIGNQAGRTNQSANSIVINATGNALDAVAPGFYVAPIATAGSSLSGSFAILGYSSDLQIVQTNLTVLQNGAITMGSSVMPVVTSGTTYGSTALVGQFGSGTSSYWGSLACNIIYTNNTGGWTQYTARLQRMVDASSFAYIDFMPYVGNGFDYNGIAFGTGNTSTGSEFMRIKGNGYVGIGTTNPGNLLTVSQLGMNYGSPVLVLDAGVVNNAVAGAPRGIGRPLLGIGNSSYTAGGVAGDYYGIGFGYGGGTAGTYYAAEIGFLVQTTSGGEYGDIVFSTRPDTVGTTIATERMRITSGGNVGIGTTPLSKLYVDAAQDVSTGICQINAVASNAVSKSFLTGKPNAALMPSFYSNLLYFYGTSGTTPYTYAITASTYFTGQHANQPIDPVLKTNIQDYIGLIVSSADQGYYSINPASNEISTGIDAITITEALPYISLTTEDKDPAVWGVLTNVKNDTVNPDGTIPIDNDNEWGDRLSTMVRVNGLGEGAVWVTNINGNIRNGDLICSSSVPGYGRKQDDDLFHSYTVAKATMSCNFDLSTTLYKCKTVEYNGMSYIAAFIGCSYHCS